MPPMYVPPGMNFQADPLAVALSQDQTPPNNQGMPYWGAPNFTGAPVGGSPAQSAPQQPMTPPGVPSNGMVGGSSIPGPWNRDAWDKVLGGSNWGGGQGGQGGMGQPGGSPSPAIAQEPMIQPSPPPMTTPPPLGSATAGSGAIAPLPGVTGPSGAPGMAGGAQGWPQSGDWSTGAGTGPQAGRPFGFGGGMRR